jgi:hypothetical protein
MLEFIAKELQKLYYKILNIQWIKKVKYLILMRKFNNKTFLKLYNKKIKKQRMELVIESLYTNR